MAKKQSRRLRVSHRALKTKTRPGSPRARRARVPASTRSNDSLSSGLQCFLDTTNSCPIRSPNKGLSSTGAFGRRLRAFAPTSPRSSASPLDLRPRFSKVITCSTKPMGSSEERKYDVRSSSDVVGGARRARGFVLSDVQRSTLESHRRPSLARVSRAGSRRRARVQGAFARVPARVRSPASTHARAAKCGVVAGRPCASARPRVDDRARRGRRDGRDVARARVVRQTDERGGREREGRRARAREG